MSTTHRSDGLDNPLSPNSGLGATWADVERACEASDAVESYEGQLTITWVGGDVEQFGEVYAALNAIRAMEAN